VSKAEKVEKAEMPFPDRGSERPLLYIGSGIFRPNAYWPIAARDLPLNWIAFVKRRMLGEKRNAIVVVREKGRTETVPLARARARMLTFVLRVSALRHRPRGISCAVLRSGQKRERHLFPRTCKRSGGVRRKSGPIH